MNYLASVATLGCVITAGILAGAAPEPDAVPRRWQLELDLGPLRYAPVTSSDGSTQGYFYLTYTATNLSGNDLLLAPSFEIAADSGPVIRGGRGVPAEVTRQLLAQVGNPLIQDQIGILGTIPHGEENAREGLVVFVAPAQKSEEIVIYAQGFSGESRVVEVADPITGEMRKVTLRKSLMARYQTPGEIDRRDNTPYALSEKRWVLR